MTCTATRHGDLKAYKHAHCRCPEATAANTLAAKAWRLRSLAGWTGHVDGTGTRRRLQALVAMGWSMRMLGERLGVTNSAVSQMCLGSSSRRAQIGTASRVRALYDELADHQGPSLRSLRHARRLGWLLPVWWDDDTIDDPTFTPVLRARARARDDVDPVVVQRLIDDLITGDVDVTAAERATACRRLLDAGVEHKRIVTQLHLSWSTFARLRDATGITTSEEEAA